MKAPTLLSSLQSAGIVLTATDGREIRLRRIAEPAAEQKVLLRQLALTLPERFELNRKCSVTRQLPELILNDLAVTSTLS